jgi:hypothetical protein
MRRSMMKPLDLELMERKSSAWAGWALLVLAFLFAADLGVSYAGLKQQLYERSAQGTGNAGRAQGGNRESGGALEKEAGEAASVIDRLSLPWGQLFKVVEGASVERVALLSVQPDATQRVVTLVGEAKQYEDVLAYVERLNKTPVFRHVHLASHEVKENDPQRPVGFTVLAQWRVNGE